MLRFYFYLTSHAPSRPQHSFKAFEGNRFFARLAEPVRAVTNCVKCSSNVLNKASLNFELIHCHLAIQSRFDLIERVRQILNLEIFDSGGGAEQFRQRRFRAVFPCMVSEAMILTPCAMFNSMDLKLASRSYRPVCDRRTYVASGLRHPPRDSCR